MVGKKEERLENAYLFLKSTGRVHKRQDVADMMNTDKSNVSRAFKGVEKYITDSFLRRFNEAFGHVFNDDWLITGEGQMLREPAADERTVTTGPNSSTAVGAGSTAIHGADADKYLDIIKDQQQSIAKLVDSVAELTRMMHKDK